MTVDQPKPKLTVVQLSFKPGARYGYQRAIKKTRRNVEGLVDKMHNEISAAEALRRLVTAPTIPIPKRR